MAITQQITQAPPAPQRSEPDTFADKADAFVAWLEGLSDELNQWASECNSTEENINTLHDETQTYRDQAQQAASDAETWYNKTATSELWTATSNTSVEVSVGTKTFTLNESNRSFMVGSKIRIVATSDPTNVWMEGVVTDYTDNNLTVNVGSANGSGFYSDWKLSLNAGSDASSVNGFNVSQTPQPNVIPVTGEDGKLASGFVDDFLSIMNAIIFG